MKGAKNLLCPACSGFFASFRQEERLGKFIKYLECPCGIEMIVTTDKMDYKIVVKQNGIVIQDQHGAHSTTGGQQVWRRNIPHYIAPKTLPTTQEAY